MDNFKCGDSSFDPGNIIWEIVESRDFNLHALPGCRPLYMGLYFAVFIVIMFSIYRFIKIYKTDSITFSDLLVSYIAKKFNYIDA